jgi:hypothetical protein
VLEQVTPFGQPRFLNQDVGGFVPQQAITGALGNLMSGGAEQAMGTSLLDPNTLQHGQTSGQAPGPGMATPGLIQDPMMQNTAESFLSNQLAAEAPLPNQAPTFKVDNIYTTDAESVGRELSRRGRLAQMQYTNRPGP